MSRHRNIRNFDYEDYFPDGDYYDDYYEEEEGDYYDYDEASKAKGKKKTSTQTPATKPSQPPKTTKAPIPTQTTAPNKILAIVPNMPKTQVETKLQEKPSTNKTETKSETQPSKTKSSDVQSSSAASSTQTEKDKTKGQVRNEIPVKESKLQKGDELQAKNKANQIDHKQDVGTKDTTETKEKTESTKKKKKKGKKETQLNSTTKENEGEEKEKLKPKGDVEKVGGSRAKDKEDKEETEETEETEEADAKEEKEEKEEEKTVVRNRRAREREKALAEANKKGSKQHLNLVVIGHVDAGKSTLMGHLLYLQGRISEKMMHKFKKESVELGKPSFHFAWVLDQHNEERSRGITVDVAVNYFETTNKQITLLDAPGHRDFIPNMISGASQADAAILVVPATKGEFESTFVEGGQTREHAILARSLGINQLIVAVNKMDMVNWEKSRYDQILSILIPFLKTSGFKESNIWPIPVSGFLGENLLHRREKGLSWYTGHTLINLIDQFTQPERFIDKSFRMCISDVFRSQTLGTTVAGKIESGVLMAKDQVVVMPIKMNASVKAVVISSIRGAELKADTVAIAKAGDNVEVGLKDLSEEKMLLAGQILCDIDNPIPLVTRFQAQIITLSLKVPIIKGHTFNLLTQSTSEPVSISKLIHLVDKTSGKTIELDKPLRLISKNQTAVVEITAMRPICLELYSDYRTLGRFSLRRANETVAVGIVSKIVN